MWIKRTLESLLQDRSSALALFPVWLVLGPRQVGKSSLLLHCKEEGRTYINLDDLEIRQRANQDPILFAKSLRLPVFIDEIQYAPPLLSRLKELVDRGVAPGSVWLSGSQNFQVMTGVRESLAGRVAILNLYGLTDTEKAIGPGESTDYFSHIASSNFPKLYGVTDYEARSLYLSSYLQTYVQRDVQELLGVQRRREFELFLKICAIRTCQLINYESLASDSGISPATAKQWLSVLEDSFLLRTLHPWFKNPTKRLVKTPKVFFMDTGLAAFLSSWTTPDQLQYGPMGGALFENHVVSNLYREFSHRGKTFEMSFWRDRDGREIDCLIEIGGKVVALEIKMGQISASKLLPLTTKGLPKIDKALAVSLSAGNVPVLLSKEWMLVHPAQLIENILDL